MTLAKSLQVSIASSHSRAISTLLLQLACSLTTSKLALQVLDQQTRAQWQQTPRGIHDVNRQWRQLMIAQHNLQLAGGDQRGYLVRQEHRKAKACHSRVDGWAVVIDSQVAVDGNRHVARLALPECPRRATVARRDAIQRTQLKGLGRTTHFPE